MIKEDWIQEGIRWNGGYKSIIVNGYSLSEARFVWECAYGKISLGKIIHHRDCNPANNHINNLQLTDIREHRTLHKQIKDKNLIKIAK